MYTQEQKQNFSKILKNVAEELDIPDSKYEEAKKRYEGVGEWLGIDPEFHQFNPEIYTQGSFSIGTVVKPITDEDEYDIDLVCELDINKNNITQTDLKDKVGNRLKENERYNKIINEGRRCWTLEYANEFHMDILPAIPDHEKADNCILITDKKLRLWQHSNPKGYTTWFKNRMRAAFNKRRILLAEETGTYVDDVPEYKVKTSLQRSVQILKRHRDIYFNGKNNKPISIIITTLAGLIYGNEEDLYDALFNIIQNLSDINSLKIDGEYQILNPVNSDENFADKWNENEELPKAFNGWIRQLNTDFNNAFKKKELFEITNSLKPVLGAGLIANVFNGILKKQNITVKTYPKVKIKNPDKPWGTC